MDILISSNLERLIFELSNRDSELTGQRMKSLSTNGIYDISESELTALKESFYADWTDEEEVADTIARWFDETGYIMDTHTAVAMRVYEKYIENTGDKNKTVVVSTASPYKFVTSVLKAIGADKGKDGYDALIDLEEETALPLPESLSELPSLEKRFTTVIENADADKVVLDYAKK